MKRPTLSVIIIAKNNEEIIKDCLESINWADEAVLVDTGSKDKTLAIAKKTLPKIKIIRTQKGSFSDWRNLGLKYISGDWILFLDTDERVTKELKKEIFEVLDSKSEALKLETSNFKVSAFRISRKNYYFGHRVKYGGSWPDYVTRLFRKKDFLGWQGEIHESPKFKGSLGTLKNSLLHYTHRSLTESLEKSRYWTKLEAQLFYKAGHPPVYWWRLLKVGFGEFVRRFIVLHGFRDGFVGLIESITQGINRIMVYVYLWEKQNIKEKN